MDNRRIALVNEIEQRILKDFIISSRIYIDPDYDNNELSIMKKLNIGSQLDDALDEQKELFLMIDLEPKKIQPEEYK